MVGLSAKAVYRECMSLQVAFSERFIYALPPGHRFPIAKYELVTEQLLYQGILDPAALVDVGMVEGDVACLAHDEAFWQKIERMEFSPKEIRRIGLPVNPISVNRARNSTAGTVFATTQALAKGLGLNMGGGTHHAYADHGEGFCLLNDIAVAAAWALDKKLVNKVLVVDLDVHQGNGTAHIFRQEPRVFTFSMHGKYNYPLRKEQSDLDVALPKGTTDALYLATLGYHLPRLLQEVKPDIVYYQSGVDVLESDLLGHLSLSMEGVLRRDELVFGHCHKAEIPVVLTMGGGYSSLATVVDAHFNTYRTAIELLS